MSTLKAVSMEELSAEIRRRMEEQYKQCLRTSATIAQEYTRMFNRDIHLICAGNVTNGTSAVVEKAREFTAALNSIEKAGQKVGFNDKTFRARFLAWVENRPGKEFSTKDAYEQFPNLKLQFSVGYLTTWLNTAGKKYFRGIRRGHYRLIPQDQKGGLD